jgi:hypothetical protein
LKRCSNKSNAQLFHKSADQTKLRLKKLRLLINGSFSEKALDEVPFRSNRHMGELLLKQLPMVDLIANVNFGTDSIGIPILLTKSNAKRNPPGMKNLMYALSFLVFLGLSAAPSANADSSSCNRQKSVGNALNYVANPYCRAALAEFIQREIFNPGFPPSSDEAYNHAMKGMMLTGAQLVLMTGRPTYLLSFQESHCYYAIPAMDLNIYPVEAMISGNRCQLRFYTGLGNRR